MAHRFTSPLPGNVADDGLPIYSDGYRLIRVVERYWKRAGKPLRLDEWQKHLLIRILERCPPEHPRAGELRYSQVVVSIPRQNGKSLLAAILSLYGLLLHSPAPKVLGVARGTEQAKIVYGYTYSAIGASPKLRGLFHQTETRGISKTKGEGSYKVLPAKPESVQGYESTFAICDELHVMKPEIWNAIVESHFAQTNPLLIGITTAGDINSVLLHDLYDTGAQALAGAHEWFGFFVYEASSAELSLETLTEANPAIACGRVNAQRELEKSLTKPPAHVKQFRLNLFHDGLSEPWIPVEDWAACAGTGLTEFKDVIYAIETSEAYAYATISAYRKDDDGIIRKAVVARLVDPDPQALKDWCVRLRKAGRCTFVVDGWKRTRFLADFLEDKGWPVIRVGSRRAEAAGITYAAIKRGEVEHDNQGLVNMQHATARTKAQGDDFVVVSNGSDIDAAYADVFGIYAAETFKRKVKTVA